MCKKCSDVFPKPSSKSTTNVHHFKKDSKLGSKTHSPGWAANTSFELLSDAFNKESSSGQRTDSSFLINTLWLHWKLSNLSLWGCMNPHLYFVEFVEKKIKYIWTPNSILMDPTLYQPIWHDCCHCSLESCAKQSVGHSICGRMLF